MFGKTLRRTQVPRDSFSLNPKLLHLFLASISVVLGVLPASAQTAIGVQQFGAYDGSPDTVNLGTLGVGFTIPIYHKNGRGSGTGIDISVTEQGTWPAQSACNNGATLCLSLGLGPQVTFGITDEGSYSFTSKTHQCPGSFPLFTYTDYEWTYTDSMGTPHVFNGHSRSVQDNGSYCANHGITPFGLTALASDGSGYLIQVGSGYFPVTVTDASGRIFSWHNNAPNKIQDSNGNILESSWAGGPGNTDNMGNIVNFSITDTVGTSLSMSGGGSSPDFSTREPLYITYLDDLGNSQTITITYKTYLCNPGSPTSGNCGLMDAITYPDGSAYHFAYQSLPSYIVSFGIPPYGYYTLASVTLPTGGAISYTFSQSTYYCQAQNYNVAYLSGLSRTTSDGTTNYTRTVTSVTSTISPICQPSASWTQVTKPNGDVTNMYFVVPEVYADEFGMIGYFLDANRTHETKRLEYSHTNLTTPVRTTMRCYNSNTGDCTTTPFNEPVSQLSVTTTLDTGISSQVITQYMNAGLLPNVVKEYDFGATSPTRKTITQYASLTNNISDRPASITVYDSNGNVAKQTTYGYDLQTPTPMTLPGHVTIASGSRGNPWTVTEQVNGSGTTVSTNYVYDDAGQVTSTTDANGNPTSYGYDSATDTYKIKVTRPTTAGVSHISTFGYGPNSGLVTNATDENKQPTNYSYDLMYRPSSVTYPDGGQTTYYYSLSPTSKTTNTLLQTGTSITSVEQLDGYGRLSQTQLTSDPEGTDYTVTTYDSLGRKSTVSNPTRCNPPTTNCGEFTWGITTYQYDALNRVTSVAEPDGSSVNTVYSGNCSTVTDEAGKARESCVDALGRLTGVWEDPGSSPHLNYETDYLYNALNNLISVQQKGGVGSGGWRTRTFTYDFLSRLVCAANPEIQSVTCPASATSPFPTGAVTYAYDSNGNLLTKTAPSPNQVNTGSAKVTTTYTYDALNRLTGKSYSDSYNPPTPGATFGYDGVVLSCPTPNGFGPGSNNLIGRRSAMCFNSGSKSWTFDPMGRMTSENDRYIGLVPPCSGCYGPEVLLNQAGFPVPTISTDNAYEYYLNGDLLDTFYPQPGLPAYEFSTQENAAGRVVSAGDESEGDLWAATYTPDGQLATGSIDWTSGRYQTFSNTYNNRLQPVWLSRIRLLRVPRS